MRFVKSHQRFISLVAAFAFCFLIQINSLPLRAETASPQPQQTGVSSATEQPGTIEQPRSAGYTSKKKSPLIPIIIGVVVVGAVAAVLILVVFKTKYDITGTWYFELHANPPSDFVGSWNITFTGTKKSGTFIDEYGVTGTYAVDGKTITSINYDPGVMPDFTGAFENKDRMSGNYVWTAYSETGTWFAVRGAVTSTVNVTTQKKNLSQRR